MCAYGASGIGEIALFLGASFLPRLAVITGIVSGGLLSIAVTLALLSELWPYKPYWLETWVFGAVPWLVAISVLSFLIMLLELLVWALQMIPRG